MALTMTLQEAGDRLAIRELIDAYAHCADRRDAEGQMALFTADTAFHVYMDGRDRRPPLMSCMGAGLSRPSSPISINMPGDHAFQRAKHHQSGMAIGPLARAIASPII